MRREIGVIYQIDPDADTRFPAKFIVATKIIPDFGVQGYLLLDEPDQGNLYRTGGRAYLRIKWEDLFDVGKVEWEKRGELEDDHE